MKTRPFAFFLTCGLVFCFQSASPAQGAETWVVISEEDRKSVPLTATVGFGALGSFDKDHGEFSASAALESHNYLQQKTSNLGLRQYGVAQSRAEIGRASGVQMSATTGVTLLGLGDEEAGLSPHVGLEPFSGRLHLRFGIENNDFYEWQPALAMGVQMQAGECRLLPLLRGGGALGNRRSDRLLKLSIERTFGAATYLNCGSFNLAIEKLGLYGRSGKHDSYTVLDLAFGASRSDITLGIRGEMAGENRGESRVLLMLRTSPY